MNTRTSIGIGLSIAACWWFARGPTRGDEHGSQQRAEQHRAAAPETRTVAASQPAQERTSTQRAPSPETRAHLVAIPADSHGGEPEAGHAALERAFDDEPEDAQWATRVHDDAAQVLAVDPQLRLDAVRCAQTFCRIRMSKPIDSELGWADIDRLLAPIASGEAIFTATPDGSMTTGYLYFSARDAALPLDQVHVSKPRPGV